MKKSNIVLWSALAIFLAVLVSFLLTLGITMKRLLRDSERTAFNCPSRSQIEIAAERVHLEDVFRLAAKSGT